MSRHSHAALVFFVFIVSFNGLGCPTDDSGNQPPVVAGVPTEEEVVVGETLRLTIDANDPEGGAVSFDYDWRPKDGEYTLDEATFLTAPSQAVFEWAPIASDVTEDEPIRLIFIVTDDAGTTTEKTVNLTVVPGNGEPRFLSNASELFDPRSSEKLEFEVEVRDDDDTEVQIEMDQNAAPVGSSFTQTGPMKGEFTWTPSGDQLKKRVHSVVFTATDSQDTTVDFKVTIVVRTKTSIDIDDDQTTQMCPGEAAIDHMPLSAQRGIDSYPVEATVNEDRFDEIFLYWTTADAFNGDFDPNSEDKRLHAVPMEGEGGTFTAAIPNQLGTVAADRLEPGETLTVYYNICAIDNDASGDQAVVCIPSSGDLELFYSFEVYNPEDTDCLDDALDRTGVGGNDSFDQPTNFPGDTWKGYRVCEGNLDYHAIQVKPGEAHTISALYNDGSNVNFKAYDADQNEISLDTSDCTGLVTANLSVPEGESTTSFYLEVSGNDANYSIKAFKTMGGTGGCIDESMEPNGTAFDATSVSDGDSLTAEICTEGEVDVYAIELEAGDHLTVTHEFTNASGNLDLELYAPSQVNDVGDIGAGVAYTSGFEDTEVLEHDATETGTYYVLVFNNNASANTYDITFEVEAAPPCPDEDQYSSSGSGNHSQDDAALLGQGTDGLLELDGMEICPSKPDWYRRTEFNGAPVLGELTVAGSGSIDDFTLEIWDSSRTKIETATKNGERLEFDFTPSASDQYFYKVSSSTETSYNFDLLR